MVRETLDYPRVFFLGKDRLLYNLLVSSTFVIKLTFIRVLFCAVGPDDTGDCGIQDCQKYLIDQEVWEIDLSSEKEWQFGKKDGVIICSLEERAF